MSEIPTESLSFIFGKDGKKLPYPYIVHLNFLRFQRTLSHVPSETEFTSEVVKGVHFKK